MTFTNKAIFIVGAKRTPFCHYGGNLKDLTASKIFAIAAKEALCTANIDSTFVDQTVVGNVNYLSQCDGGKTPRYCGLYSGVPVDRPALGVNKSCGSGLQAIVTSALDVLLGTSKVCLVGGTELMSTLPLLVRRVRFGTSLGAPYELEDHIKHKFDDSYTALSLQEISEATAKRYQIGRREADEYTLQSYKRWEEATKSNIFTKELAEITVNIKKKDILLNSDQTKPIDEKSLGLLPSIINSGVITTTGNSASAADGAAALVIASEDATKHHGIQPVARVVDWSCTGDDPADSAAGVVAAVRNILAKQNLKANDVDIFEINETFASDILVIAKELKLGLDRINVNGGALALGHPVAASGARMAVHLVHELKRRNLKRGIAASTCGIGQGIALMIERV